MDMLINKKNNGFKNKWKKKEQLIIENGTP